MVASYYLSRLFGTCVEFHAIKAFKIVETITLIRKNVNACNQSRFVFRLFFNQQSSAMPTNVVFFYPPKIIIQNIAIDLYCMVEYTFTTDMKIAFVYVVFHRWRFFFLNKRNRKMKNSKKVVFSSAYFSITTVIMNVCGYGKRKVRKPLNEAKESFSFIWLFYISNFLFF